jgi:hypothetical protein
MEKLKISFGFNGCTKKDKIDKKDAGGNDSLEFSKKAFANKKSSELKYRI